MARNHREEILSRALVLAEEKNIHASHALLQTMFDLWVTDTERKAAQEAYAAAIMMMPIGHGLDYDRELLRQALRISSKELPACNKKKRQRNVQNEQNEKEIKMSNIKNEIANETDNAQNLIEVKKAKVGRARKYNIGDRFNITGNFGLQPTSERGGVIPSIKFQLSYKEKKCQERGFSILPAGTEVLYLGCRNVFGESSKKMVFKVLAGTLLVDGSKLDRDVETTGVVSRIVDTATRESETSTTKVTAEAANVA